MKKLIAMLLALLMLAGTCLAEEAPVALTVNGKAILKAEVQQYAEYQYANGGSETLDYEAAISDLIVNAVANAKIKELGLDQFTEEEQNAFRLDAQAQWQEAIDSYVSYYLAEDTEEARAQAEADGAAYYTAMGYSEEMLYENLLISESYEKLQAYMLEGHDLTADPAEVLGTFTTYADEDKAMFEGNVGMYEMYQQYYSYPSWYRPEGYRGVTHILLEVDEALLKDYTEKKAMLEEEGSEVTQEDVDAALAAVIASRQADIDAIYSRLEKGEAFETLIAEFGTDPGMQNEEYLKSGYDVHQDSLMYDPAFTAGAFSEKMQQVGDVSDPVVGSYGIHILYYLRDIAGGYVELTDEIRAEIENYLVNTKRNTIVNETMEKWMAECEILRNEDVIASLYEAEEAAAEEMAEEGAAAEETTEVAVEETTEEALDAETADGK